MFYRKVIFCIAVLQLAEYVLCTIQEQKKKDKSKEGSGTTGENKVKAETEGIKGKAKAASKKRKVKQEDTEAENIPDQAHIEDLHLMKRPKVPMTPAMLLEPQEGYEMGMLDYNSCPRKSSPVLTVPHDESPLSEILPPGVVDNDRCSPNMAPTSCLPEPPRSEMMSTSGGGNYNTGSAGSNGTSSTDWDGWFDNSLLPEITSLPYSPGNTSSFNNPSIVPMPVPQEPLHTHMMRTEYATSLFLEYSYQNIAPSMVTYQPATNYAYRHPMAAPAVTYSYHNSAAQNTTDPGGYMAMLMSSAAMGSQSLGGRFAVSSQYHGGPSVHGQGRAAAPAAALPRQDQVTARM
jgi:hypothetical protein